MVDFNTDGKLGVKLTETEATTSLKRFSIGECVTGNENSKFMYTRAVATVDQYDVLSLLTDSTVTPLTLQNASANGGAVAFAQTAIAAGSFGWVALQGNKLRVKCLTACADSVPLFATTTAGEVDDATGTSGIGYIAGVRTLSTISNATAVTAICQNAHVTWYGNVA
tara:strand:- start:1793 stop:2293 length:501 start_codon:yes stop_codon:yes gene_type:complete